MQRRRARGGVPATAGVPAAAGGLPAAGGPAPPFQLPLLVPLFLVLITLNLTDQKKKHADD